MKPLPPEGPVLLSSRDGSHTGLSGYSTLERYIPGAAFIEVRRRSPRNPATRFLTAINRRLTLVCWTWGSSLRLEYQALRLLRQNPHRLLHYLWADRDMAYLDLFKRRLGFKIIGSFHNCPDQLEHLFNFPRRLGSIDHFLTVSSCQVESLLKNGVPKEKISVVLHGVDTAYFLPAQGPRKAKFQVLSVGSWRRDFTCMEEIFRRLSQDDSIESTCLIEPRWRERWSGIRNLRLPDRVSDEQLLKLYQSADVLLMCAEASTANNALVEALACGLPVVGSDVGGIKEYVTGDGGLFFGQGDATGAVTQIMQIRDSPELAKNLSEGARRRGKQLDWRTIAAQTIRIHESVTAGKW